MKRTKTALYALSIAMVVVIAACGNDTDDVTSPDGNGEPSPPEINVALVLNGELGDEAFFDSANRGVERARDELGVNVRVFEAGLDPAGWEPALRSAVASREYDLVITGTFPMGDVLGPIAEEFIDQQFIFYDAELPGDNIHSIMYAQNEASYLGGIVAGGATISDELEGTNPDTTIGFVGGLDLPVINDFLAGFQQGAESVDASIQVLTAYAGDFGDPGRGRELAEALIDQGADVLFQVAGGTGIGVIEAADSRGIYAIGVDTNQNPLAPGTVLTSVEKNVDRSLFQAIERFVEGELPFGVTEFLGLDEEGVSIAKDDLYEQHVPATIRALVDEAEAAILAGEIRVDTTLER